MPTPIPLLAEDPAALETLARAVILYTDLDGTLLTRGSVLVDAVDRPSLVAAEAIVELERAGLAVVPVSGRTAPQLVELTRLLGWRDFVAEAGGLISRGFGAEREVIELLGEWEGRDLPCGIDVYTIIAESGAVAALAEAFPGRIEYHTPWHENRRCSHLLRGCVDLADAQAVLDDLLLPIDIVDNGVVRPHHHTLTCPDGPPHAYHLVPRGVTKATAIERDLADRGLAREQAVAIGDSVADLQMAEAVGTMVLVGNALDSPAVRDAAPSVPNARLVERPRGEGWAQFARLWLQARGPARG